MHEPLAVIALGLALATGAAAAERELALAAAPVGIELAPRTEAWSSEERLGAADLEPGQQLGLTPGARLGAVAFDVAWRDFRGQSIAPGRYELRYLLQPRLKEHVGADAIRDFAVLVAPESTGASARSGEEWIARSRSAARSRHPAVMALLAWSDRDSSPSEPVAIDGRWVAVREIDGLTIGFVVAGKADAQEAL